MKTTLSFFTLFVFCSLSFAQGLQIDDLHYHGTGCPAETAGMALAPSLNSSLLLFDEFLVEAAPSQGEKTKSCRLTFSLSVPENFQVSLGFGFEGFVDASPESNASFQVDTFLWGSKSQRLKKVFSGPRSENFVLESSAMPEEIWTPCSYRGPLVIHLNLSAKGRALALLDKLNVFAPRYRRCL